MTREEEIKKASFEAYPENIGYSTISDQLYDYNAENRRIWVSGVEWADEHPKRLYVVTRCEEHSDYIEKVFVDENKANDYCEQFEGDEDAYGRDITEIDITL